MKAKNRNYLEPLTERLWEGFMSDDTFNDSTEYNIQKIYDLESQNKELIEFANKGLTPLEWKDLENVNKLKSLMAIEQAKNKELIEENNQLRNTLSCLVAGE